MTIYAFFATTPKAMEPLLAEELNTFGADNIKPTLAGCSFSGTLETAYRACLWSRIANRILLVLTTFPVKTQDDLYNGIKHINWFEHMTPDNSLAVTFTVKNSQVYTNTHFGALKVKDAVVDQMRAKFQKRPSIDTEQPDIHINVHLQGDNAQVSLDFSGSSLHRRDYRETAVKAPIKENLAAAMLLRSGWPEIAKSGGTLVDPMCGSGTLPVEAALIAADYAPGLNRSHFGFTRWKQHDAVCWAKLLAEAEIRKTQGLLQLPVIVGFDQDRHAVNAALQHIANAGLSRYIHVERRNIADTQPAESWKPGLVICNPPYGERLGDENEIAELYKRFGHTLKQNFPGWQAGIIISNPELGFRLGIRSQKPITLYNGALECKLLRLRIEESAFFIPKAKNEDERLAHVAQAASQTENSSAQAEMFANRLRKNLGKLGRWLKQNQIHCFRAYDADLPEYAVAVDVYRGEQTWINVQEYEPPKTIDQHKADQRLAGIMVELPKIFDIPPEQVFLKIRRKQKNTEQYEKLGEAGAFRIVEEGGCKFQVNFENYLDTGLFLDHRPIRLMIQRAARGKRFLNLFAYTGSATVHAVKGGASATTTVDMSNTYINWAKRNLALNGWAVDNHPEHEFIQADCLEWLAQEAEKRLPRQYDLIFLDPPTFSNSKRMDEAFDIQQHHAQLIRQAGRLLAPEGVLYFSTNFRRFRMDEAVLAELAIEDISAGTIPEDFSRDPKIHYCWKIQHPCAR
ncbi:MAG: bifunctional 23S rRNA (guanine(2069)-N(7))-methyltransferase RlmK/23S rRNA (guanine(2445)-N(2))-methyltransferase RlmL [Methylomonas sp.]|nr:MAG: bifunctional 23S rRNA (guanine(2069)-N(7))-methyltransferase RlmK/23S rRNA (guanine(2445)-N(2))-methyltransferase RlmL [Methylobacter sp.]PPD32467.1 MAG: bifunctional 23S rRNA (guanine(2069)-N(7))-methyltransferase RlmK/23S rRNA (guanine(2445)-N(2))-methyltransferase RlmL [Methylomonas sp.]